MSRIKKIEEDADAPESIYDRMSDPAWTDHIIGELEPYEIIEGAPKVDGLRRIALKYLGPFSTYTTVEKAPEIFRHYKEGSDMTTEPNWCVRVGVEFKNDHRRVEAVGETNHYNSKEIFLDHALATAESQAEGRALKKALFLTKVYTAEELKKKEEPIAEAVVSAIKSKAHQVGLDAFKVALKVDLSISDLSDLRKDQGKAVLLKIDEILKQGEEGKDITVFKV